jgi:hypothetical protein
MTSVGEVTAEEGRGRKCFLVRPAGNRTGNLSLMRRVWYHKTTASAPVVEQCPLPSTQCTLLHFSIGLYIFLGVRTFVCFHLSTLNEAQSTPGNEFLQQRCQCRPNQSFAAPRDDDVLEMLEIDAAAAAGNKGNINFCGKQRFGWVHFCDRANQFWPFFRGVGRRPGWASTMHHLHGSDGCPCNFSRNLRLPNTSQSVKISRAECLTVVS